MISNVNLQSLAGQVITLTSDFGSKDHYCAVMKASLINVVPTASLIDISHEVDQFDIIQAAYLLQNSYSYFPLGTIHVAAINLYYDSVSEIICFQQNGQYFVGPNNGIFTLLFPNLRDEEVYKIECYNLAKLDAYQAIASFAHAISHKNPLHEIANKGAFLRKGLSVQAVANENTIRATIIHVDHYENVIVNLKKENFEQLRKGRDFGIFYNPGMPVHDISQSYGDVPIGEVLCLFNTSGYLEIAINMGQASSLLNLRKDETIHIDFYNE